MPLRLMTKMRRTTLLNATLLLLLTIVAEPALPVKKVLTLAAAKKIAGAAETEAKKRGASVVIVAALALLGATPLQGGVPIIHEGRMIGAIAVSGNTPQEDEDIAKAGAASAAAAIGD